MSEIKLPKPGAKLKVNKLKDAEVVLHPNIFKWRDAVTFDPLLYNSLGEGQIQPIVFRKLKDKFQLLAGSRRYFHQKLRKIPWDDIHKEIREDVSDRDALLLAASENIFREDFTPWEEARAINDLLMVGKMSVKEVATHLGKPQAYVTSRRSLLSLSVKLQARFEKKAIPIGYAAPVKKLAKFPEAQKDLIEKIIAGMASRYGNITTIDDANEYVTKFLHVIKEKQALLNAYGPCPKCGSKDISLSRYGDEKRLMCNNENCSHQWHKDTKEPWKLFELKQEADEMGFTVDVGAETMTLTPKDVAEIQERNERERLEQEGEAEKVYPEKFRSKVPLEAIILPMLRDNIQKAVVSREGIKLELIESPTLSFTGLKKDYKAGELARIEVNYGWDSNKQEIAKQVHEIIAQLWAEQTAE